MGESAIVKSILTLLDVMSFEEREIIATRLASFGAAPLPNGSEVTRFVSDLFRGGREWSVAGAIKEAAGANVECSPKQVYNAIGYLARRGAIKRLGYGRYVSRSDAALPPSEDPTRE